MKKRLIRIIISLILFIIVFTLDKTIDLDNAFDIDFPILTFSLYLIVYLLIGYDVIFKAIRNICHGQIFDENFLMCVATIGAYAIGAYEEAVAVLLFYQIGEYFQDYAVNKSRKSISSLMDIRPDYANLLVDGEYKEVDPENVKIGDIILVKPGEKIPLDGIIIKGETSIDTKSLTGEALPKDCFTNDLVISGCVNISSQIEVKVEKEFYDSTVSKILDLVENATSSKAKYENFITKFAKFYTPIVCFLALLLFLIPGIITGDYQEWLYRALNFLVVSCPCALVISIPLSFFSGIGAASKNGILIKGSNYLEQFNKVNVFTFDKTGTLTKGNFKVSKIYPEELKDEIIKYAAIAEYNSSHPIARSIVEYYNDKIDTTYELTNISGKGIMAKKDSEVILCGNEKLLADNKIEIVKEELVGTIIHVARNNKYLGYILITDEVKEESSYVIKSLNEFSKTIMLTGDNLKQAEYVKETLNLSDFKASLLPQDKVLELKNIMDTNTGLTCFIGDGINDAPVLATANIGIAMGVLGSDAAIEASDIVLMKDDLKGLLVLKKIAKKTMRVVLENIIFALTIKIGVLILSALGITNMWIAVFADVGVAILAILNAMRVGSKKYEV